MSRLIKSRSPINNAQKAAAIVPIVQLQINQPDDSALEPEISLQAKVKSEEMISRAKSEAETVRHAIASEKENWETEKRRLEEEAREEGYREGLQYGRQDGFEQTSGLIREANSLIEMSRTDYHEKMESSEETIVTLAVRMAEKIIGHTLEENSELMSGMVRQLIKEVKDYEEIKLFVHPGRYEYVRSQKNELKQMLTNEQELYLYMDEGLSEFDCFVETSFGRIDASVQTQLQQLERQLKERLNEGDPE
ncbi:flagellar assembly protein FliH [Metabacillus mangrovi]|uniref:flagellar assembly protein FliH n=1 Tax=Metabacillus mangrovi TaxID=1491830 RepID=UPI001391EB45|nr:flagellar assembly protein FliH [Metabacillus mangrovi]